MSQPVVYNRVILHCHVQPMMYHSVNCHVKECFQFQAPLCVSAVHTELSAVVAIFPGDHLLTRPELLQNAPNFLPLPVPLQYMQ